MPIVAADLKAFQSVNMPENDTATSGGGIVSAEAGKVELTDIAATDTTTVISDGADIRTVTITGRNAAGAIVSEALVLNGATRVTGTQQFERILKIVLSAADAARTVTITRNNSPTFTVIATLGPNYTTTRRLFYDAASEASSVLRYEKFFWKNDHATLTLTNAKIKLIADPQARVKIGLATAKDDTGSVANRKTVPGGITFVDDNVDANVPGTTLEAQAGIGVWVEQSLPANDPAFKSNFTTQLSGTTT